jgi:hypothetical protein
MNVHPYRVAERSGAPLAEGAAMGEASDSDGRLGEHRQAVALGAKELRALLDSAHKAGPRRRCSKYQAGCT